MKSQPQRQNYDSGEQFVLEYGELRFSYNARDFRERVEQTATQIKLIDGFVSQVELDDLEDLVVNGEIDEPASDLGRHIIDNWAEMSSPEGDVVHWLRRTIFRTSWLDQRVIEGELDVVFDTDKGFVYVDPERDDQEVVLATPPSWEQVQYRAHSQ